MTGIDTNVFIYACDRSDLKKQERALDLITDTSDGVLLWQVACEFVSASRKLAEQGFSPSQSWSRLADFLAIFPLVLPTREALERARHLHLDRHMGFWDAMIVGCCIAEGVGVLYSEDLPGGRVEHLDIVNPFA